MAILSWFYSWFARSPDQLPLQRETSMTTSRGLGGTVSDAGKRLFRPFSGRDVDGDAASAAITDLLVTMRETLDRQGQRHEELMTYLSQLPKAMEMIPENSRLQAEALGAVRQHLENQGASARQFIAVLEKIGQATVDQRRIFDAVRGRLDMLAENDQRVAEHFTQYAGAIKGATETTAAATVALNALVRREDAIEQLLTKHQKRHTVMLATAMVLAAAALVAASVAIYVVATKHS